MSGIQEWTVTEPWLNIHCKLGEGPYYEPSTKSLRFVDIKSFRLHTVPTTLDAPTSKDVTTIQLDGPVTVTADIEGVDPQEKILIGMKYGLALLDRKKGTYEYVTRFAPKGEVDDKRLRSNDGAVDPNGRMWLGSMTDFTEGEVKPEGGIFLISPDLATKIIPDMYIPNSISWSPDNKILYYTDSTNKLQYSMPYTVSSSSSPSPTPSAIASAAASSKTIFYKHTGEGDPDGHRIDAEGNMWFTTYGGSCIWKLSPEGKIVGKVSFPTRNITCCEFVGTVLYVTTANDDDNEDDKRSKELGGAVFRVDVGVEGLKPFKYKM